MYLRYGSYTHALGECFVAISRQAQLGDNGRVVSVMETWSISGMLIAASTSALTTAIQALEAAYASNGYDLTLFLEDGVTASAHVLDSSSTTTGTIVIQPPSYTKERSGQYTTFRDYSIIVQAETKVASGVNPLLEFSESITFQGNGGPRIVARELRNGPVQMQTVSQVTPVRATQQGRATGYSSWPAPSAPIWPAYLLNPDSSVTYQSPATRGGNGSAAEFEVSWNYQYIANVPLSGRPPIR